MTTPALAARLLQQIATHLKNAQDLPLMPTAIKLLADSLTQIFRIEQISSLGEKPANQPLVAADLLPFLSDAELRKIAEIQAAIDAILDSARQKLLADAGITPLRKIGR